MPGNRGQRAAAIAIAKKVRFNLFVCYHYIILSCHLITAPPLLPPSTLQHSVGRHGESFVARESWVAGGAAAIAIKVSIYFFHMLLSYYFTMSSNHRPSPPPSFNPSAQRRAPRQEVHCEGIAGGRGAAAIAKKVSIYFFHMLLLYHVI